LFSDLSPEDFALIRRPIDERRFGRGETLFRAGDSPHYVYTVREGLVKLEQYLPDGTQRIVRLARPGDLIGLETLLGSPYGHDAVALEPVLACRIPVDVIKQLDRQVPELAQKLMERWQRALTEADSWLTELATGSTQVRVARLLIHLVGDDSEGSCYLPGREDIAAIIGTATETASRVVAEFRRSGFIEESGPHQVRVDQGMLGKIASR
jgi:CRP-like cAMP-binding protein